MKLLVAHDVFLWGWLLGRPSSACASCGHPRKAHAAGDYGCLAYVAQSLEDEARRAAEYATAHWPRLLAALAEGHDRVILVAEGKSWRRELVAADPETSAQWPRAAWAPLDALVAGSGFEVVRGDAYPVGAVPVPLGVGPSGMLLWSPLAGKLPAGRDVIATIAQWWTCDGLRFADVDRLTIASGRTSLSSLVCDAAGISLLRDLVRTGEDAEPYRWRLEHEADVRARLGYDPALVADVEALASLPGIGGETARALVCGGKLRRATVSGYGSALVAVQMAAATPEGEGFRAKFADRLPGLDARQMVALRAAAENGGAAILRALAVHGLRDDAPGVAEQMERRAEDGVCGEAGDGVPGSAGRRVNASRPVPLGVDLLVQPQPGDPRADEARLLPGLQAGSEDPAAHPEAEGVAHAVHDQEQAPERVERVPGPGGGIVRELGDRAGGRAPVRDPGGGHGPGEDRALGAEAARDEGRAPSDAPTPALRDVRTHDQGAGVAHAPQGADAEPGGQASGSDRGVDARAHAAVFGCVVDAGAPVDPTRRETSKNQEEREMTQAQPQQEQSETYDYVTGEVERAPLATRPEPAAAPMARADARPASALAQRPAAPVREPAPGPRTSDDTDNLFRELACAQLEFAVVTKTRVNTHFGSKYANLSDVCAAIMPALKAHGLVPMQIPMGNKVYVRLVHGPSGQWIEGGLPLALPDHGSDVQRMGSALSYVRRYLLTMICGVVAEDEDDDGNAASPRGERS